MQEKNYNLIFPFSLVCYFLVFICVYNFLNDESIIESFVDFLTVFIYLVGGYIGCFSIVFLFFKFQLKCWKIMLSSVVPQLALATLFTFFISLNSHTTWKNTYAIGWFFLIFHLLILGIYCIFSIITWRNTKSWIPALLIGIIGVGGVIWQMIGSQVFLILGGMGILS